MSLARPPRFALFLALSGTLPVLAAVVALLVRWPGLDGLWLRAVAVYGAVIVSFVAGAHWGLACAAGAAAQRAVVQRHLAWSVVPALAGWAVAAQPLWMAYLGLAVLFPLLLVLDRVAVGAGLAPIWWPAMRLPPTVVIALGYLALGLLLLV
ncbi:hypothetical protein CCR85_00245 [Rhodothalassium salexigens]|uniref:DUF3429 domain-containing protein n=1 Tax=Rhodothalassium salexigens TaxID=1086 RepID=UPI00191406B6|nr:DUF3429 domain-containing protein [Rhodothalassium salexigens]MBK5909923.1 hypothetical protein [Rhodothalassium salexigens]MBK5921996.1 hypothetical protein [Rhodothalassium salexigens]